MTWPKDLDRDAVAHLQRVINTFTDSHLRGLGPLIVDGSNGPATRRRIRLCKYMLGYRGKWARSTWIDDDFRALLRHPNRPPRENNLVLLARVRRGRTRRRRYNWAATHTDWSARFRRGIGRYDGKPVAKWLIPYLQYAREHGWQGVLVSGYRTPWHSEQVCIAMCGQPTCPGICAGRNSNHAQAEPPPGTANGAVDVSDYARFGAIMADVPIQPRLHNALGPADPVHFSPSGR